MTVMAGEVRVWVTIENVYPDGTVVTTEVVTVPAPPDSATDLDEWAEDHLYPLTGTGRPHGDAGYFLTINDSSGPTLVGATFEWGL